MMIKVTQEMTEQAYERLIINLARANNACHECGGIHINADKEPIVLSSPSGDTALFVVSCKDCGNTRLFNIYYLLRNG